jgi:hypothetical protein
MKKMSREMGEDISEDMEAMLDQPEDSGGTSEDNDRQ